MLLEQSFCPVPLLGRPLLKLEETQNNGQIGPGSNERSAGVWSAAEIAAEYNVCALGRKPRRSREAGQKFGEDQQR